MSTLRRFSLIFLVFGAIVGITAGQGSQGRNKGLGTKVPLPDPAGIETPEPDNRIPRVNSVSVDVELVNVDVVVTDQGDIPISGLTKADFKVFDDNVEQTISLFSQPDEPVTAVLLMEFASTSRYALPLAAGFIRTLRPEDFGALVTYDYRPNIVRDFTKNKDELLNGLMDIGRPFRSDTRLYDSVWETLDQMKDIDGRKAIFLLSSGLDTTSYHGYPDLLKKAAASDTMIYSLGIGSSAGINGATAGNVLRSLAEETRGAFYNPPFMNYQGFFEIVDQQLRNRYSLGFVPSNRLADGKFHKLKVEVPPFDLAHNGKLRKPKVKYTQGYFARNGVR